MRKELLEILPRHSIGEITYYSKIYHQPSRYHVDERISLIKYYIEQRLSFFEIGCLFGVTEKSIKYQWDRYYLKTWKPKTKKSIPKTRDVYAEFEAHYDDVMR